MREHKFGDVKSHFPFCVRGKLRLDWPRIGKEPKIPASDLTPSSAGGAAAPVKGWSTRAALGTKNRDAYNQNAHQQHAQNEHF